MKKFLLLVAVLSVVLLESCSTQHLCPTYSDSGAYSHRHTPHHLKHK